jgi:multidrug efflux pump subunit AcrB
MMKNSSDNVGIVLSLDDKDKTSLQDIQNLKNKRKPRNMIPISDLVKKVKTSLQKNHL